MTRAGLLVSIVGAGSALALVTGGNLLPDDDLFDKDPGDAGASVEYAFMKAPISADEAFTDHRAWQHGIDLIPVGQRHLLIWSSWGNPPAPVPSSTEHWHHQVYTCWIDPAHPKLNARV